MASIKDKIWGMRHPPADPTHLSYKGKTVLVTGANSGLGFEAAVKYAQLGASTLILAVRSVEKGEAAKTRIISRTKSTAEIIIMIVDLSTFASVQAFVQRLNQQIPRLHVAQLAAGVMMPSFTKSADGYEMTLQVNVLSTALMALLLLPKMHETALANDGPYFPHMCILNSLATQECKDEWIPTNQSLVQRINDADKFDVIVHYYLTKLAARFFMQGLAARYCDDGNAGKVIINSCCPGFVKTNLDRNFAWPLRTLLYSMRVALGRSAEEGSRTLVSATGLGLESNGKLWLHDELPPPAMFLASERAATVGDETYEGIMFILREHDTAIGGSSKTHASRFDERGRGDESRQPG